MDLVSSFDPGKIGFGLFLLSSISEWDFLLIAMPNPGNKPEWIFSSSFPLLVSIFWLKGFVVLVNIGLTLISFAFSLPKKNVFESSFTA